MRPSLLLGEDTHRELVELLRKEGELTVSGAANETAKALLVSHFLSFLPSRPLLVTGIPECAEGFKDWFLFFEENALSLEPVVAPDGTIVPEHLRTYFLLMEGNGRTTFSMPRSVWDSPFPLFSELREKCITLKLGDEVPFTEFVEELLERGYSHGADRILAPGEYRRTGDTLDIYPIQSAHPYRVAFDFDVPRKILAVDRDDPSKTGDGGRELTFYPVRYTGETLLRDQFPPGAFLVLDDQEDAHPPEGVPRLLFTAFPERSHHVHLRYLSVLKFYTLTDFLNDLRDKLRQQWAIFIVTKRTDELTGILEAERIPFATRKVRRAGTVTVLSAAGTDVLPHSLQNPDLKVALLTDREIFTLKKAVKARSVQKLALDFVTSLQHGDYVVHMDHGIGHFEGMTRKEIDGVSREYLEITYAGGDKLFIPVDQADKLSKYVYEEGEEPALTRLGAVEWKRVTEKMQSETRKIAEELLALYARRAKAKGFAFGGDTAVQKRFEEAFPYEETPGQTKAVADIKQDMEGGHPMDRLVCGDVGFGKTEVAMRAAFKAVQGGKQAAIIAPITILADQHYRTFQERMAGFPVRLDMLSRFRTVKEQRVTLGKLRKGEIDVVVGTHRILQPDVRFLNLGLVIIDEEQRFGVKQKERFKELRASVDILTLTATPIPRTLNLGLHRLRDISAITTPPPGRLPIITEVRKYSDELVRQAILGEIGRGGQCYVLHNRVETIDAFAGKLRMLVPEARFVVGHGQLRSDTLEDRILAFKDGEFDVLVSSTIIENGIDLPRANTLIVNEAERFGLAQLYQLRGRVGRSRVQAYAYFLYHTQRLRDDAKKRLRAIVEACELGSGFQVAMRDLEIRGAGEILGAAQSGTMQTVGVSHYLRMLKRAVDELSAGGEEVEEVATVEIQLPVQALIPTFYIPDEEDKIGVYQKLAGSEDEEILAEFEDDLLSEYGSFPDEVKNLFAILRLKLACQLSGVLRVKMEESSQVKGEREIVLALAPRVKAGEIMQLLRVNPGWRISGSTLRVEEKLFLQNAGKRAWVDVLTEDVRRLAKVKKEKKTSKK